MASVRRRKATKFWWAYYRDSDGVLYGKSTKLSDRKKAQRIADALEATAQRRKSAQHVRAAFTDLLRDIYGEAMPTATIRNFSARWLEQKKPETASATYLAYQKTTFVFTKFLGAKADRDLSEISSRDLVAFRNSLAGKLSADTTNRYIKILRMLFKAAQRDGYIVENPAEFVELVRDSSGGGVGRRPLTIPEIKSVLSVADPEWQSLIKFGLYTGQRLGDLASLTWANIDLERNELRLTTQKTGKRLTIPLGTALRAHIESVEHPDKLDLPLHPRAFEAVVRQGRAVSVSNWFTELLAQAGLREKRDHQSRGIGRNAKRAESLLSFHSLRHTAVSLLKDAGIPQAAVQELIGHDSAAMSQLYTHTGRESLLKAANALPEV